MFPKRKNIAETQGGDGNAIALAEQRLATKVDTSKSPKRRGAGFAFAALVAATALAEAAPAQAQDWGEIARGARDVGGEIRQRREDRTQRGTERDRLSARIADIDDRLMLLVGTESLAPMELSDLPNPRLVPVDVENDSNASTIHRAAARYRARVERIQAAFEQGRVTGAERNVELGDGLADYRSVGVEVLRERRALIVERRAAISQRGTETERRIEQGADTIGTVAAILNRF